MRVEEIWNNAPADIQLISIPYEVDCGQDMRWLFQIVKNGTNGDPILFIEESLDDNIYTLIPNYLRDDQGWLLDESEMSFRDSYFMGKWLRFRIQPNDNTTGLVSANLGIKTKSN
jgi:hypothetical protein